MCVCMCSVRACVCVGAHKCVCVCVRAQYTGGRSGSLIQFPSTTLHEPTIYIYIHIYSSYLELYVIRRVQKTCSPRRPLSQPFSCAEWFVRGVPRITRFNAVKTRLFPPGPYTCVKLSGQVEITQASGGD